MTETFLVLSTNIINYEPEYSYFKDLEKAESHAKDLAIRGRTDVSIYRKFKKVKLEASIEVLYEYENQHDVQ